VGKQLAELGLKKIAQPDLAAEVVTIPTQLVKRESCSPVFSPNSREARLSTSARRVMDEA